MKFLDSTGLGVLWNKIKSSFLSLNGGGTITNTYNPSAYNIQINTTDPDWGGIFITGGQNSINNQRANLYATDDTGVLRLTWGEQGADMNVFEINPSGSNPNEVIKYNGENLIDGITASELNSILV